MTTLQKKILYLAIYLTVVSNISIAASDSKLYGDIDNDGRVETVTWKKFASDEFGDYYQLFVIDDDGKLLWRGPRDKNDENPLIFSSLDIGISLPELLIDFDNDGYMELLSPMPQSDVSPTFYRKLRWRRGRFEPLPSTALMMSYNHKDRFVWRRRAGSFGSWVSNLTPYRDDLAKAEVTQYSGGVDVKMGIALIRFNRIGAVVLKWIKPLSYPYESTKNRASYAIDKSIGVVFGLDPYGDGFLSIRKKPNSTEIGRLYNGDRVEILGRSGKWYKIRDSRTGKIGWSYGKWIRIE